MDDLTAGEALPHVSAAHIDLPPRRSARSVARLSIAPVGIERAEPVDGFPKVLEATMCGIVIKYLITTSLCFIAKPDEEDLIVIC